MENKNDILNNLLCMACLCVGRSIQEVKDERLKKYYMDTLNEIPVSRNTEHTAQLQNFSTFFPQINASKNAGHIW